MKKILALTLALMMVLTMATTAFAATVTVEQSGHNYVAYQILTGSQGVSEGPLGDAAWGDGIDPDEFLKALKADATVGGTFASVTDAMSFAKALEKLTDDSVGAKIVAEIADAKKIADKAITLSEGENVLKDGYYLIVDVTETNGVFDSKNAVLLQVTRDIIIADKSAKPTVDKQVHDEEADAEYGHNNGWGETADHAMNESFQFKLIATLPADPDFAAYETYKVVFNDTMSTGVTFESIGSVKVNGTDVTDYTCTAKAGDAGTSWTLTIADIKKYDNNLADGAVIEVIYNAHLNENAAVGNIDTNKNTVYLQYSNNPNIGGEEELGKTTEDTVWVFTYEMKNTKVDGDNKALADAGFKLYSDEACETEVPVIYDTTLQAYRLTKGTEAGVEMKSAKESGVFNIVGLDVGTYYLKETTTPAGYNTCAVVKVEITAVHVEDESKSTATTAIVMKQDGANTSINTIVNKAGAVLPETGGMGTTIFYAVGGVLVVAAVVLLVTKKRASSAK